MSVQIDAPIEVVPDAAPDDSVAAVSGAVETVASHLHPVASYDLADHPRPTGREEVWRFTPLKRLRGLLDDERRRRRRSTSRVDAPEGVDGHARSRPPRRARWAARPRSTGSRRSPRRTPTG